jgi:Ca2+-dependent lipid-binding protein
MSLFFPPLFLHFSVVSGINLRKTEFFGTPDPFVKIALGTEGFASKPAKKTLSPVWNQSFVL